jgi:glycosyltransferase involved in cell wall biosynthesis
VPIRVVPLGLSDTFHPENHRGGSAVIPHAIKRKVKRGQLWFHRERFKPTRKDPFVFLAWGDRGESKGWKSAIFAFNKAFAGRNDVRLIIKARSYSIGYDVSRIDNVEILQADLDEEQMLDLYLRCDAMVFPSHGEGFGFPPREFAATGGPVICTRWWADDIEKWGYPVNYTMAPAWPGDEQREGLGMWAQPDIDHLAKQMTHQYQHDARILRYMANRSAKHIRKMCNWERFAGGVWDAWQEACEGVKDASA